MKEERGIKKWTGRRLIPSLTAILTTGHLGVMLYIGYTDNTGKNIQPKLKPVYEITVPRTIC